MFLAGNWHLYILSCLYNLSVELQDRTRSASRPRNAMANFTRLFRSVSSLSFTPPSPSLLTTFRPGAATMNCVPF